MPKRKRKNRQIVGRDGDPCPRCGQPTEIREHVQITARELRRPFYYSRWFYCINPHCRTTMIMPDRYRVYPEPEPRPAELQQGDDIVIDILSERPPWE